MDCCSDNQTITIYKGFPTHFNNNPLINVSFDTPIDLTGFSAIFRIGETEKTYTDIADGFSIDLTKEETGSLPVGLNYGELIVVDNETHKRPFTTALPFNVKTFVDGDIHLDNYNVNVTTKIKGVDLTINIETQTLNPEEIERYISEHNLDEESHPYILGELDKKVDKVSTANRVYGTDENGDQTTYDANSFGQVDDVQVGGVSVVQNKIASLGTMAGKSASDYRTASDQDTIDSGLSDRITANTNKFSDYRTASSQDVIDSGLSDRITNNSNRFSNYRTASEQDSIDNGLSDRIDDIEEVIPEQASAQNQLADKNFVNSSIATNTSDFIGTFNSLEELEDYSGTVTNNDYAFVVSQDTSGNTVYNRYKWNGTEWLFEYALNNSSFTADQWASINSTATASKISQIATNTSDISALQSGKQDNITGAATTITSSDLTVSRALVSNSSGKVGVSSVTETELGYLSGVTSAIQTQLNGKQATISDLSTIRSGASAGATALQSGDNISELNNDSGYITGITSSMVTTALGYTPYNSTNPNGYTSNVGTVTSVNNVNPVNGNVSLSIPIVDSSLSTTSTNAVQNKIITTELNKKTNGFTLRFAGNWTDGAHAVNFITFDYSECNSENGIFIKLSMVNSHGNGITGRFFQDVILNCSYTGVVAGTIYRYFAEHVESTMSYSDHNWGDIFWTIDTTNKIVKFYVLMRQYSYTYMTPYFRLNASTKGVISQKSGVSQEEYSSGTQYWSSISWFETDQTYSATSEKPQSGAAIAGALSGYQTTANLVTSVSSSSTNSQYPSAKCVYDIVGNIETLLSQV